MFPKPFTRRLTVSLLVAATLIPISSKGAGYTLGAPEKVWEITSGVPDGAAARSMAVSAGKIYTLAHANPGTMYYTDLSSKSFKSFSTGVNNNSAVGTDDYGNIVFASGIPLGSSMQSFTVLPAGATSTSGQKTVTHSAKLGADDFIGAAGNLLSVGGGYVYFVAQNSSNLTRLPITYKTSKLATGTVETYTLGEAYGRRTVYAKPNRNDAAEVSIYAGGSADGNKIYTLDLTNKTASNLKTLSYNRLMATTVGTGDKKFIVYGNCSGTGWKITKAGFIVESFDNANVKQEVTIYSGAEYQPQGTSTSGIWLDAMFDETEGNILVYAYLSGKAAYCYKVPVTKVVTEPAAPTDLTVTYEVNKTDQPGRVDAVFTWTNSPDATTHILQRKSGDNWVNAATLNDGVNTYTIVDATVMRTYRVVAKNNGYTSQPSNEVVCDPPFAVYMPTWLGNPRTFPGYAKVQLRWRYNGYGHSPSHYEVWRDGVRICAREQTSNYVDLFVPEGEHTYQLCAIYVNADGTLRTERGWSEERTVHVAALDTSKDLYGIDEIYNYRIDKDDDGVFEFSTAPYEATTMFTDQELYRQGAYYKGYWFVAQREDNITYDNNGTQIRGTGKKSGIIRFDANAGSIENMSRSATRVYESDEICSNIGIAVDDAGTFFIRARTEGSTSVWDYSAKMTKGRFLVFDDALKGVAKTVEVDFGNQLGTNRCDYYAMRGDVLGAEGGYLYMAETNTHNMYRCHFINGKLEKVDKFDHSGQEYSYAAVNAENYCYPLDGRDDVVHQLRSTGYFHVDLATDKGEMMLDAYTRTSNAGGTSIWYDKMLFIITPESPHSKNVGNFYVMVAETEDGFGMHSEKPEDALVTAEHLMPVLTYQQPDLAQFEAPESNANGNWYKCVPVAETDAEWADGKRGFFLYQYVPGMRFAKYRIYPLTTLPTSEMEFDVELRYDKDADNNNIDIKAIDGVATWKTIQGWDQDPQNPSFRAIHRYMVEFTDRGGNVFETRYFDPAGTECASLAMRPEDHGYIQPTFEPTMQAHVKAVDEANVTARISVYFRNRSTGIIFNSAPSWATNRATYHSEPATNPSVKVFKGTNIFEEDGQQCLRYRMDIDFQAPVFDSNVRAEPVSYYQVEVLKPGSTEWQVLPDLCFTTPQPQPFGSTDVDRIQGTYNFANDRKPYNSVDEGATEAVVSSFVTVPADKVEEMSPADWRYRIAARYAADEEVPRENFNSIARNEYVEATAAYQGTTGIEGIDGGTAGDIAGSVYDLKGVMLIKDATDAQIEALPAGFYIRAGKTFYKN